MTSESDLLLGALRCHHWALSNDEIAELHAALLEADDALDNDHRETRP